MLLVVESQDDARGDGLEDRFGFGIHCFMSTIRFLLCTFAYAIPCSRPISYSPLWPGTPTFYSSSVHFYFFCLLYTILVRSPTPDHLFIFWTFFLVPLLFLCASCQSEVLLKSERYDNGSGRCMSEESKTKLEVLRSVVMYCSMAIWVRQQQSSFDERRIQ